MSIQYGKFAKVYDRLMCEVDYDAWAKYLASFLPAGASVAECGCGTGSITVRLKKQGFDVTGLDLSPEMLEEAGEKARAAGQRIPFICQDMRHIALHRPVDAVISACDGVNYLTAREDLDRFFRSAAAALKPGGLLLFDLSSRWKIEKILGANTFGEDDGETAYLWRNLFDPESRLIEMNLSFFVRRGELFERFTERHIQRAHSETEVRHALEGARFENIQVFQAFTREAPGAQAERLQFAAEKSR